MENTRRRFLITSGLVIGGTMTGIPSFSISSEKGVASGKIMTVLGPIDPSELKTCLPHEHIISRFGEDPEEHPEYDYGVAEADIVPYLKYMKKLGCDSIFCCTTKYFGRDVGLLKKVSEKSGIHIIANTGFYASGNDRYVPKSAFEMSADQIAEIWTKEFELGIDDSDIKPGFIKLGIDGGPLSEIDAKLVRAGAKCHVETGLTIQVHTGDNLPAVKQQFDILKEEKVSTSAWIWIHGQNVKDGNDLIFAATQGAWISLDALRTANYYEQRSEVSITVERHLELLLLLREQGFLNQVLLSHDGSSYPQKGKSKRTFEVLFTTFIPMMKSAGISDEEIHQLTVVNPRNAFQIKKRLI